MPQRYLSTIVLNRILNWCASEEPQSPSNPHAQTVQVNLKFTLLRSNNTVVDQINVLGQLKLSKGAVTLSQCQFDVTGLMGAKIGTNSDVRPKSNPLQPPSTVRSRMLVGIKTPGKDKDLEQDQIVEKSKFIKIMMEEIVSKNTTVPIGIIQVDIDSLSQRSVFYAQVPGRDECVEVNAIFKEQQVHEPPKYVNTPEVRGMMPRTSSTLGGPQPPHLGSLLVTQQMALSELFSQQFLQDRLDFIAKVTKEELLMKAKFAEKVEQLFENIKRQKLQVFDRREASTLSR